MVQWKAFGDNRAYDMMLTGAQRHFERTGYSPGDASLKASTVIAQASADTAFAKLTANAFDQEQMLRNDLTGARVQVGPWKAGVIMQARGCQCRARQCCDRAGASDGAQSGTKASRLNAWSFRDETSRRIGFINALSGEARSSAVSQLAHATRRSEAQVLHALEAYNVASQVGTADGVTAEAQREGNSVYGRTREAAGYDFAERSGKLDAQREVGPDGARSSARIGEQRGQADNAGLRKALEQKVRLYAKPRGWMLSSAHWPVPPETSSTWQRRGNRHC
jgi:conjugal transfer mating pair stabilization protein TraG